MPRPTLRLMLASRNINAATATSGVSRPPVTNLSYGGQRTTVRQKRVSPLNAAVPRRERADAGSLLKRALFHFNGRSQTTGEATERIALCDLLSVGEDPQALSFSVLLARLVPHDG